MTRRVRAAVIARLALPAVAAGLAACAVGPDFNRPAPPASTGYGSASAPSETVSAEGTGGNAQRFVTDLDIPAQWWTLFQSQKLTAMVEDALKRNPNLAAAEATLRQAHELFAVQQAAYFPLVQGGFSASHAKNADAAIANPTSSTSSIYSLYTAQLTLSYTPDVFGLTRRSVEAAKAQEEGARFQREAVYLTLSSNVVVTAVQEATLRGQIAATERLLDLQHQLTETVRGQRKLGVASDLDLLTQQTAEAQTAATLPPLQKQLGQTRDALTALLGRLPDSEPSDTFTLEDLTLPGELPVSVPSKLVAQRPDVRQAEENLHAASAQVGVAIANMLPLFNLTADAGTSALQFGSLFGPYTSFWDLGASLTQTLLDGGALIHRRRAAEAGLDEAGAQYRAAVILACQNVADTLRALDADAAGLKATLEADRAAHGALDLARGQYKLGAVSFVVVLNAEQAYQQAELALVVARANRYSDTAGLFQSLGGGWWNRPGEALNE
jgi:NodT family efflux transporter outer membrane factor (OMF) lipoprotein